MIPLKAEPRAIARRKKVGMEAEAWVRSVSGALAIIRLDTKLQDIPNPIPMIADKSPITQRGPAGITYTRPSIETLIKTDPILISLGWMLSLNPEVRIAVRDQAKDSSAIMYPATSGAAPKIMYISSGPYTVREMVAMKNEQIINRPDPETELGFRMPLGKMRFLLSMSCLKKNKSKATPAEHNTTAN